MAFLEEIRRANLHDEMNVARMAFHGDKDDFADMARELRQ